MRDAEQIADDLYRNSAGKIFDQIPATLGFNAVEQAVDQLNQTSLHFSNRTARECAHDDFSHAGVKWRVVKDQTVGVVFVQWRALAVFRSELGLLVGAKSLRVFVDAHQIGMSREK